MVYTEYIENEFGEYIMKTRAAITTLFVLFILSATPAFSAPISLPNFGFEDGLTGWTVYIDPRYGSAYTVADGIGQSYAQVLTSHTGNDPDGAVTWTPTEGDSFLRLRTTNARGIDAVMVGVYQTFTAQRGDTLSGYAAFDARVPLTLTSILEIGVVSFDFNPVYFTNVPEVGGQGDEPWTKWTWTAPRDGAFALFYLLTNPSGSDHTSYAMFDAVPIPTSLLFFGSGLIGLIGLKRRKKAEPRRIAG